MAALHYADATEDTDAAVDELGRAGLAAFHDDGVVRFPFGVLRGDYRPVAANVPSRFFDDVAPGLVPDVGQAVVYRDHSQDGVVHGSYRRAARVVRAPAPPFGPADLLVFERIGVGVTLRVDIPSSGPINYTVNVGQGVGSVVYHVVPGQGRWQPAILTGLADPTSPAFLLTLSGQRQAVGPLPAVPGTVPYYTRVGPTF